MNEVTREIVDPDGDRWTLWEQPIRIGERATSALCFESSGARRRLWGFPPDWARQPDDVLLQLLLRATPLLSFGPDESSPAGPRTRGQRAG